MHTQPIQKTIELSPVVYQHAVEQAASQGMSFTEYIASIETYFKNLSIQ